MEPLVFQLKAIADETRLKIVKILLQKNRVCVRALAKRINISESAISQHLKVLREANLVTGEKHGYFVHYVVKKEKLLEISAFLHKLANTEENDSCCLPKNHSK